MFFTLSPVSSITSRSTHCSNVSPVSRKPATSPWNVPRKLRACTSNISFAFPYQHDDSRRNGRIHLIAALRAFLHDRSLLFHRSAAYGTETAVAVPIEYLECFSRCLIICQWQVVVRSAQACHYPFFGFGYRLSKCASLYFLSAGQSYLVYFASRCGCYRRGYSIRYTVFVLSVCCVLFLLAAVGL